MAKAKRTAETASDMCSSLIDELNKSRIANNGTAAYLQDEHADRTCGIRIPHLAFQWLVGGTDTLPIQRHIGVSGLPKSFKSTLGIEIGNWFLKQGGIHIAIDNEGKTSATMLRAMTQYDPEIVELAKRCRIFKETGSVEEWQDVVTDAVKFARKRADRPKGSRVPVYVTIDSLNGKAARSSQEKIMQEGSAEDRGFPVEAMKITKYFKTLNLLGTLINIGYVQHLVQDLSAGPGYNGPSYKESGAVIAAYQGSVQLRVHKGKALPTKAKHAGAPVVGPPIDGYTLYLTAERSCVGPDKRTLPVDVLWQYVEKPGGNPEQVMWYDWDGALGRLLIEMKYADKGYTSYEKERLNTALEFVQFKTNHIKCPALGLEDASPTEFGKAISANQEIRDKISSVLNISKFFDIQQADIDFCAPAAETEEDA